MTTTKQHVINNQLTELVVGKSPIEAIALLKMGKEITYSHCVAFGKYLKNKKLKVSLDSDYNVSRVYNIVYKKVKELN